VEVNCVFQGYWRTFWQVCVLNRVIRSWRSALAVP